MRYNIHMKAVCYYLVAGLFGISMISCQTAKDKSKSVSNKDVVETSEWVAMFNEENLDGWTARGSANWTVKDGTMIGQSDGGHGHIYASPELTDLEVKGSFRLSDQGGGGNSGLYFRANPPVDNPEGYPRGYEAQICHNQDAHTGWLWKPGTPTGKANA